MNSKRPSQNPVSSDAPDNSLDERLQAFNSPDFCCVVGEQLLQEARLKDALRCFQKAVALDSESTRGWFGQGMVFTHMEEYARSREYFRKAISLDPGLAIAHHNLGRCLHEIGQADLACQSFQTAIKLGFTPTRQYLAVTIPGCPSASNQTVLAERRQWADELFQSDKNRSEIHLNTKADKNRALRIGYVSAFFHRENWMKPVWGLLARHQREDFQIHLFSDRTKLTPTLQKFLKPADQFHDISGLSNDDAAALVARHEIDILVDLNGYSYPDRFPLFLRKPAPLIIGWFNMYATTGFDCFDYLVGDDCVIPQNEEPFYSEKIARVSGSYLTFSVAYDVPDLAPPPCISNQYITFGSLISQYKITDQVIDTWCNILNNVSGSRLLIRNASLGKQSNREYLLSEFVKRGIDRQRLTLEGPAAHFEFLQTYNRIDIALDAFPYNGGTTTTEAIWQGVPVVAYRGDRWVSRTSATLLRAAGLNEMVAADAQAYVQLATQLASDPGKLKSMRSDMREKLLTSDACDTVAFAASMENLYRRIWQERQHSPGGSTP